MLENSISWNIRDFFGVGFFIFFGAWKYSVFKKKKKKFHFSKYSKSFLLRKYNIVLNLRARKSHFPNYKESFLWRKCSNFFKVDFFLFSELRKFHSPKYKKTFLFWENIRNFFREDFFIFWASAEKWSR